MPAEMTLKFEDDELLTRPIDILAWSWGFSGSQNGAQDLSLTKYIGPESARVMELANLAIRVPRAVFLTVTDTQRITMTLKQVLISSQCVGGSGGEDRLTENMTLSYADMEFKVEELLDGHARGHSAIVRR